MVRSLYHFFNASLLIPNMEGVLLELELYKTKSDVSTMVCNSLLNVKTSSLTPLLLPLNLIHQLLESYLQLNFWGKRTCNLLTSTFRRTQCPSLKATNFVLFRKRLVQVHGN